MLSRSTAFSVILYLTDTMSTALPRYKLEDGLAGNNFFKQERSHVWDDGNYISFPVTKGTVLFFNHEVIHAGVENTKQQDDRTVLFAMFSKDKSAKDNKQIFDYVWFNQLYGPGSPGGCKKQFIDNLLKNAEFEPLLHLRLSKHHIEIVHEQLHSRFNLATKC
jgi:hypothetical protein